MRGRLCKVLIQAENKFVTFRAFHLVSFAFLGFSGKEIWQENWLPRGTQTHNEAHPSTDDKSG